MPDRAYWTRALRWFASRGLPITVTFTGRAGHRKEWTGRFESLADERGPLIVWQGELHPLCPWDRLIAIEDVREATA